MTPEQRSTIDKAATLKGATITQWALDHLMADARKDIEEETTIRLSAHAFDEFKEALEGPMPQALQGVNQQIFSQWLPTSPDYKIAAGINVEMYSDASKFEQGTQDQEYYCEIWIPVEKKE